MSQLYNQKSQARKRQALRQKHAPTRADSLQASPRKGNIRNYIVPKPRLAIEVDDNSHFQIGQPEYDKQRQEYIESCGIQFLRFTNKDIQENLSGVIEKIVETTQKLKSTPS